MRLFLKLIFVLFVLAVLIVVAGLFLPKQHKVVQKLEIPVSRNIVYEQIADFRNWERWSPWISQDSGVSANIGEVYQGQQAEMQLESPSNGNCNLTITHAVMPESIAVDFNYGLKSKTTSLWYLEPTSGGCKINWTLNLSDLSIFERYLAYFQKKKIEELIVLGIEDLAAQSLKLKYSRTGDISSIQMPLMPAVIMIDSVAKEKVESRINEMDAYLLRFFERRELKSTGTSFKLVFGSVNDTLEKVALGYPIESRTWVWRTLSYIEISEGEVLTALHYGLPDKTHNAHLKLQQYIEKTDYISNGTPWEVSFFRNDTLQNDTSMWVTQVFYPVIK